MKKQPKRAVVIECATKVAVVSIETFAKSNWARYSSLKKNAYKVRIFAISECLSIDDLKKWIKEQNPIIIREDSHPAITAVRYLFKMQYDPTTLEALISTGKVKNLLICR